MYLLLIIYSIEVQECIDHPTDIDTLILPLLLIGVLFRYKYTVVSGIYDLILIPSARDSLFNFSFLVNISEAVEEIW